MSTIELSWADAQVAQARDAEEADAVVQALHTRALRDKPLIVDLTSANGDTLSIGVGRDEAVLSWTSASLEPPYFASRGEHVDDGHPVEFEVGGEMTEFPKNQLVPMTNARAAVREFAASGALPTCVRWQEV